MCIRDRRKTIERRNEKRKKGTERGKERIKRVSYLGHIVKQKNDVFSPQKQGGQGSCTYETVGACIRKRVARVDFYLTMESVFVWPTFSFSLSLSLSLSLFVSLSLSLSVCLCLSVSVSLSHSLSLSLCFLCWRGTGLNRCVGCCFWRLLCSDKMCFAMIYASWLTSLGSSFNMYANIYCFILIRCVSPWYNRHTWPGVKSQCPVSKPQNGWTVWAEERHKRTNHPQNMHEVKARIWDLFVYGKLDVVLSRYPCRQG